MPTGAQVWDDAGNLIVDTSTALMCLLGITTASAGFSVTDDNLTKGTPWYFFMPSSLYQFSLAYPPTSGVPSVSFSGNVMTVSGSDFSGTFYWGVF